MRSELWKRTKGRGSDVELARISKSFDSCATSPDEDVVVAETAMTAGEEGEQERGLSRSRVTGDHDRASIGRDHRRRVKIEEPATSERPEERDVKKALRERRERVRGRERDRDIDEAP